MKKYYPNYYLLVGAFSLCYGGYSPAYRMWQSGDINPVMLFMLLSSILFLLYSLKYTFTPSITFDDKTIKLRKLIGKNVEFKIDDSNLRTDDSFIEINDDSKNIHFGRFLILSKNWNQLIEELKGMPFKNGS